jgi:hypothetical protein
MRITFVPFLCALMIGCSGSDPSPKVDRIEMRKSGWSAVNVSVNSQGKGQYLISDYPHKQSGSFSIPPEQFTRIVERLQPFRRKAVPFNEQTTREFFEASCPKGVQFVTDQGAIWVHWTGPNSDQHYLADLGCDAERNAARNKELVSIVKSFPVPFNW